MAIIATRCFLALGAVHFSRFYGELLVKCLNPNESSEALGVFVFLSLFHLPKAPLLRLCSAGLDGPGVPKDHVLEIVLHKEKTDQILLAIV